MKKITLAATITLISLSMITADFTLKTDDVSHYSIALRSKKNNKKNKKKKLDEKGTKKFANYLNKALKEPMKTLEIDYKVTYIDTLIYITLPQETKYSDKTTTQKAVDNLYKFTSNTFEEWAKKNGYRLKDLSDFPGFYVESEDGTIIAELDKLSGTMKIK